MSAFEKLLRAALRQRNRGQSLILVALILPFLIAFVLTCIEIGERFWEKAAIEDALQQATRSSVQNFRYSAFAENSQSLDDTRVKDVAERTFIINLTGLRGMVQTPAEVAAQVIWTVLPNGGTCTYPNGHPSVSATTPMVCATLKPRMTGLLGWGEWTPQIDAASTLDAVP
jgi:Flp pilus assembly protein TadG